MEPSLVNDRIAQWAQMARPGAYQKRVASLLDITPDGGDPGQPARLALGVDKFNPVSLANLPGGSRNALPGNDFNRNTPLPAIGPVPGLTNRANGGVKVANVALPASTAAPLIRATKTPSRILPSKFITENPNAPRATTPRGTASVSGQYRKPVVATQLASAKPAAGARLPAGSYMVQLGAFSSADGARQAWKSYQAKYPALKGHNYASTAVTVKGRKLYRLAAIGYSNTRLANAACGGIKAKGGGCIVRKASGGSIRLAQNQGKLLAAR